MIFPGFIGSAYRTVTGSYSGDRLVNHYFEPDESDNAKSQGILIGTPGTTPWQTLPSNPVRAMWEQNGRAFAVAGSRLYELFAGGTNTDRGGVGNPGGNAWAAIVGNGPELLIGSGTNGYIFNLGANTLTQIPGWLSGIGASGIAMVDSYFIASQANTRNFFISGLLDGTTWNPLDLYVKEGWGDNIETVFADHRELWLFGSQTSEVWWNAGGNVGDTFQRLQGAFIEAGIAAARSVAKADNTILWLGKSARGQGLVWRANGYVPQRVSNFGVEALIAVPATYPVISDAVAYTYEMGGHSFYVLTFPTANATWVLDLATNQWHEREWWDSVHATSNAVRGRNHIFAFGKHLVGDFETGVICELSPTVYSDYGPNSNTGVLRAVRRAPHLSTENKRNVYNRFELDMQKGLVPSEPAAGSDPIVFIRTSDDGGYSWSSETQMRVGKIGQFGKRVFATRLGQGRDRVFEVYQTDPSPRYWTNAYLEMTKGLS